MNKQNILMAAAVALILVGCGSEEPVQSVEWWKAHPTERASMMKKCMDNPGELAATPNCLNASKADTGSVITGKGYGVDNSKLKAPTFSAKPKE